MRCPKVRSAVDVAAEEDVVVLAVATADVEVASARSVPNDLYGLVRLQLSPVSIPWRPGCCIGRFVNSKKTEPGELTPRSGWV